MVLAEQVDRRVRLGRPLMHETIDRLNSGALLEAPSVSARRSAFEYPSKPAAAIGVDPAFSAAAGEGGSKLVLSPAPELTPAKQQSRNQQLQRRILMMRRRKVAEKRLPSTWRLILSVFLPFAAGYYLAYLFRTINAAISPALASDFGLSATELGLLASVYFLVFGLVQIPIGAFLDRFGPRRVQGVLLVIAAGGATLFGNASSFPELLAARAMIGLGVAGSLMAGLKVIVTWFPKERVALANGWMIMLGSFGAVTATAPTDWLLELVGWRGLFGILTLATFR